MWSPHGVTLKSGTLGRWEAGSSSLPSPASPIRHRARPWAPHQQRAGKSHTPTFLAGLIEGGRETPFLSVFFPEEQFTPNPHFEGSQEENLGTSTGGSGPLRGLLVPCGHLLHNQLAIKLLLKGMFRSREGRSTSHSTQLLTPEAPSNFLSV